MAEGALTDRLDQAVDALLSRRDASFALRDPELAPLARMAADLSFYPSPEFKTRLRAQLERSTTMSAALVSTSVREHFTTITPYIRMKDAGLVDFLRHTFGAAELHSARGSGGGMHREVLVGDSMIMIGEGGAAGVMPIRPSTCHVYVEDVDATFARAIAAGGTSLGAPENRPYGERAGFVKDPFGNHWYIAAHLGDSYVPASVRTLTPFLHAHDAARQIEFLKQAFAAAEERREEAKGVVRYAAANRRCGLRARRGAGTSGRDAVGVPPLRRRRRRGVRAGARRRREVVVAAVGPAIRRSNGRRRRRDGQSVVHRAPGVALRARVSERVRRSRQCETAMLAGRGH